MRLRDERESSRTPWVMVSILNWNNPVGTIRCVEALTQQSYQHFQVVVVDNGSTDDSVKRIKECFPGLHVIQAKENLGYAAGHGHAVALALNEGFDLVWLLNTDVVFKNPEVLSALVDAYLENGNAIYGSVLLDPETSSLAAWSFEAVDELGKRNGKYVIQEGQSLDTFVYGGVDRVFTVSGASMMVPIEVIRKHGFIKDHFFLYWEENDYCWRMAQVGYPSFVVPDSLVIHPLKRFDWTGSKLGKICNYYYHRNYLITIRNQFGLLRYLKAVIGRTYARLFFRVFVRSLRRLNQTDRYWTEFLQFLAVRDSLLSRMGKTLAPEDYLGQ